MLIFSRHWSPESRSVLDPSLSQCLLSYNRLDVCETAKLYVSLDEAVGTGVSAFCCSTSVIVPLR